MTPAPVHVRASCPVCGIPLQSTTTLNEDGTLTVSVSTLGTDHVGAHYK